MVGVTHPTLGEEVAAFVVARSGAELDAETVRGYARERIAAYKYPRHVILVEQLPRGPTGEGLRSGRS